MKSKRKYFEEVADISTQIKMAEKEEKWIRQPEIKDKEKNN